MKALHRTLLFSIVPFISPTVALGESPDATDKAVSSVDSQGSAWRASKLIGTDVKNAAKESVGEIKDVVVDLKSGNILGVVISSGGFLGVADTVSVVPTRALKYDADSKGFVTALTKDQLGKAPQFKTAEWTDATEATLGTKLRGMRDAIGGDVNAPDNTAQNEKDRKETTTTPLDQGNSESDLKTTKDIRAAVVAADLSFNAKNIKIITQGGLVTLRGVVASKDEHLAILKIVKEKAANATVTDELKVKND